MATIYCGRESYFHGKSLYEIARNLRNFGAGRYVQRKSFMRYPEPSFYKLTEVVPEMNAKGYSRGQAYGEKVFRGKQFGLSKIDAGGKHDWVLIPKDQEHLLLEALEKCTPLESNTVDPVVKIPPLMEMIIREEAELEGFTVTEDDFYWRKTIVQTKFNSAKIEEVDVRPIRYTQKREITK